MGSIDNHGHIHDDRLRERRPTGRADRRRAVAGAVIATLAFASVTACAGDDSDAGASFDQAASFDGDAAESDDGIFEIEDEAVADAPTSGTTAGDGGFDLGTVGRDVIIEMRVSMASDDIGRTVSAITADAAALGGGVASSDVRYGDATATGEGETGYAIIVVKVPPASIDRMLTRLGEAGNIRSINQSARDVTEQLVDLDVRISNARRSVESVRGFMERTEDLSELVALEAELTRRQTELERLEAQQRNIRERVALSTITIEVVPAASLPDPADDGSASIVDALRTGWDAFVALVFTVGFVVAVLAPFLIVAGLVGLGWWLVRRRSRPTGIPAVVATEAADVAEAADATGEPGAGGVPAPPLAATPVNADETASPPG